MIHRFTQAALLQLAGGVASSAGAGVSSHGRTAGQTIDATLRVRLFRALQVLGTAITITCDGKEIQIQH